MKRTVHVINQLILAVRSGRTNIVAMYQWYREHFALIAVLCAINVFFFISQNLPYINWFIKPLFLVLLIVDWAFVVNLFRIAPNRMIIIGIGFYLFASLFSFLNFKSLADMFGQVAYGILLYGCGTILYRFMREQDQASYAKSSVRRSKSNLRMKKGRLRIRLLE